MRLSLILICVFICSFFLTFLLRSLFLKKQVFISIPNDRSSHDQKIPTSGGLSVVIVFLSFILIAFWQQSLTLEEFILFFVSGFLVALAGFWDDFKEISPFLRLGLQLASVVVVLSFLEKVPSFDLLINGIFLPISLIYLLLGFYLMWLINLYNFMDGIDGLASIETIIACLGSVLIIFLGNNNQDVTLLLILSSAVLGFVLLNFPKAKIFMGDVCSYFLGLTLGTFSLYMSISEIELFCVWIILLGVFIVDSFITLLQRLFRGERIYVAHRDHAYQKAAINFKSHVKVTISIAFINIFWLFPLAYLVYINKIQGLVGILIAYLPLILIQLYFSQSNFFKIKSFD